MTSYLLVFSEWGTTKKTTNVNKYVYQLEFVTDDYLNNYEGITISI